MKKSLEVSPLSDFSSSLYAAKVPSPPKLKFLAPWKMVVGKRSFPIGFRLLLRFHVQIQGCKPFPSNHFVVFLVDLQAVQALGFFRVKQLP